MQYLSLREAALWNTETLEILINNYIANHPTLIEVDLAISFLGDMFSRHGSLQPNLGIQGIFKFRFFDFDNPEWKHILSIITGKNRIQKLDVGYRKSASKQQE